jgi:hypothetical protein
MPKFVKTVGRIYSELGLVCDGTSDNSHTPPTTTPNPTSGNAILQMLKRGEDRTPTRQSRDMRSAPPSAPGSSIMDLLRKEFATPPPPPPPPPADIKQSVITGNGAMDAYSGIKANRWNGPEFPAPVVGGREHDSVTISRSDLRVILREMVCSDRFIDEMFLRLSARTRQ